jgi:prepilin-type N-terminal cleavage/methylation domain-containing protein
MIETRTRDGARRQRGFTFIEVLVVMGIIAVLAGMTVVVLQLMARKRPMIDTETRINKLAAVVGQFHARWSRYPPGDPRRIQRVAGGSQGISSVPNSTNVGIESLFQALYWETGNLDPQLADGDLCNTDDDELDKPVTSQGPRLFEVKDGWDNPLIYFVNTEYTKRTEDPPAYLIINSDGEEEEVFPKPWKYEAEGRTGFAQPRSFQIFSMGPDRIPNTEDDVKSW